MQNLHQPRLQSRGPLPLPVKDSASASASALLSALVLSHLRGTRRFWRERCSPWTVSRTPPQARRAFSDQEAAGVAPSDCTTCSWLPGTRIPTRACERSGRCRCRRSRGPECWSWRRWRRRGSHRESPPWRRGRRWGGNGASRRPP